MGFVTFLSPEYIHQIIMLWVYGHYKYFIFFSAWSVFIRILYMDGPRAEIDNNIFLIRNGMKKLHCSPIKTWRLVAQKLFCKMEGFGKLFKQLNIITLMPVQFRANVADAGTKLRQRRATVSVFFICFQCQRLPGVWFIGSVQAVCELNAANLLETTRHSPRPVTMSQCHNATRPMNTDNILDVSYERRHPSPFWMSELYSN